jgi:hypothetical protein
MHSEDEIFISKSILPNLPEHFEETNLGFPENAIRQYRGKSGIHVREYESGFVVHQDNFDPRTNPLKHLAVDSPETIAAFASAIFLSGLRQPELGSKKLEMPMTPFAFLIIFFSLNNLFRAIKHILFH